MRVHFFLSVLLLLICSACGADRNGPQGSSSEDIQKQLTDAIDQYVMKGKPIDELQKLHQIEYKVFTLPIENSPATIEGVLSKMGEQKWDCYHVERVTVTRDEKKQGRFLFFCKRKYNTPLRYVPQSLLGR